MKEKGGCFYIMFFLVAVFAVMGLNEIIERQLIYFKWVLAILTALSSGYYVFRIKEESNNYDIGLGMVLLIVFAASLFQILILILDFDSLDYL